MGKTFVRKSSQIIIKEKYMETPFAEYKATELPEKQLNDYFVEPKYISKMYTNNVSFIIGQRGTGKTTLLKHLCSYYNTNLRHKNGKIGIYYRFDVNKMHSFSGSILSEEEWDNLFAHCFSIEMCLSLTNVLLDLKTDYPLDNEEKICRRISRLFFEESSTDISSLESLKEYLELSDYIAKRYKRNPLRASIPMISECEKTFEEFCRLISEDKNYQGICVHFLFDEYENMLDYQKQFINSCAKNASSYHTYKICVRPYGANDMKTRKASEKLEEANDFKTLDYIKDIIGDTDDVAEFMKKACARRLKKYYENTNTVYSEDDLQIERYFPPKKTDDEMFEILSKNTSYFDQTKEELSIALASHGIHQTPNWNLLQMKLFLALSQKRGFDAIDTIESICNEDKKYKNWLNNYKRSILFLCYSEMNTSYNMSGFDDIITIAGNVVRYVLEICDYCFLCTNTTEDGKYCVIDEKMQTEATYKVSQRRFQQISTIPDYGQEIKQMVLVIGKIFNMYHRDPQLKRFEPNHFSIERKTVSGQNYMESKTQKAIQLSVTSGVFEATKSTKNRNDSDIPIEDEDFHLHPILTPYFQISWRQKQKCRFTLDEINDFLFGSDESVTKILEKYSKKTKGNKGKDEQIPLSFTEIKTECY